MHKFNNYEENGTKNNSFLPDLNVNCLSMRLRKGGLKLKESRVQILSLMPKRFLKMPFLFVVLLIQSYFRCGDGSAAAYYAQKLIGVSGIPEV